MKIKTLLVTEDLSGAQREALESMLPGTEIIYQKRAEREEIDRADVLFGHADTSLTVNSPSLKWLHTPSAGSDHLAKLVEKGVLVTNSTGAYGPAISEHMLAMLLSALKRLPEYLMNQKAHKWQREGSVRSIEGSVLLSLGLGDIGSTFSRKMKALGAYTIGVRRSDASKPDYMDEVHLFDKIDELLPCADIIALSLPNNAATRHIINEERMALMKPETVLINIGRGVAVDTEALVSGLSRGYPSFACLDVTDPEPLPLEHPLWDMRNVIITPHCSGGTTNPDTPLRTTAIFLENLAAYLEDRPLRNIVDAETGYRTSPAKS